MPLPDPYLPGTEFGLPASCKVHRLANVATQDLTCGEGCRIDAFVTITGRVMLGDYVHIGTGAALFGAYGITIGTGTSVSPGAKIFTASDDVNSPLVSNPQLAKRAVKGGRVLIGSFCAIGANSVVLAGADIENETQIGALSLVKQWARFGPRVVAAGIPAQYLKPRHAVNWRLSLGEGD